MRRRLRLPAAALLLIVLSAGGRPAEAQVSGSLNQWTATTWIERLENGEVQASVAFDDNGSGGSRRGGFCLVTDLGLGRCTSSAACSEKAIARGLPGIENPGWYHYCEAAATDDGTSGKQRRCWSRPGSQGDYCTLGVNQPDSVRTKAIWPYGIDELDDDERDWTVIACLAGGTAPDGTTIGDPLACAQLTTAPDGTPLYKYVIDTPIEVERR